MDRGVGKSKNALGHFSFFSFVLEPVVPNVRVITEDLIDHRDEHVLFIVCISHTILHLLDIQVRIGVPQLTPDPVEHTKSTIVVVLLTMVEVVNCNQSTQLRNTVVCRVNEIADLILIRNSQILRNVRHGCLYYPTLLKESNPFLNVPNIE